MAFRVRSIERSAGLIFEGMVVGGSFPVISILEKFSD
jgi:hypothetical protein